MKQMLPEACVLFHVDGRGLTTGVKRNRLIRQALDLGIEYVCFFDDDDLPAPGYVAQQLAAANSGCDCGELWGAIYFSGRRGKDFHHSIKYDKWGEDRYIYKRTPNHLNVVRTAIMEAFPFPDQVFGEDGKQSEAMAAAGVLKTMHPCTDVIYHYFTGENKDHNQEIKLAGL